MIVTWTLTIAAVHVNLRVCAVLCRFLQGRSTLTSVALSKSEYELVLSFALLRQATGGGSQLQQICDEKELNRIGIAKNDRMFLPF